MDLCDFVERVAQAIDRKTRTPAGFDYDLLPAIDENSCCWEKLDHPGWNYHCAMPISVDRRDLEIYSAYRDQHNAVRKTLPLKKQKSLSLECETEYAFPTESTTGQVSKSQTGRTV